MAWLPVVHQRAAAHNGGGRSNGGGGASDRRRKKGAGWTMGRSARVGRMPLGPARRENKEKEKKWDGLQG
jgi:hypothetical protein